MRRSKDHLHGCHLCAWYSIGIRVVFILCYYSFERFLRNIWHSCSSHLPTNLFRRPMACTFRHLGFFVNTNFFSYRSLLFETTSQTYLLPGRKQRKLKPGRVFNSAGKMSCGKVKIVNLCLLTISFLIVKTN